MTGLPGTTVKLDDGSGSFPYDITTYVPEANGCTWNRGRADELANVDPGSLSLTLDNINGEFTYGATNLVPAAASSFEDGTVGGWSGGGVPAPTVSNSTAQAVSGTHSLKVTWGTGSTLSNATRAISGLTIGQTYAISIYVYVPTGNPDVSLSFGGVAGTNTNGVRDQWVRLSTTKTATATTHSFQLFVQGSPTSGQFCYLDLAMVNAGTAPSFLVYLDQPIKFLETLPAVAAACNLANDSSFETNVGGWINNGSGTTMASDTTQAWTGSASMKVVPAVENYGYYTMDGTTHSGTLCANHTVGATYTAAVWVYSTTAQALSLMDYGTGNTKGPTVNVQAGVWTRLYVTFVAGTNVFLSVRDPARARTIDAVWLDGWLITTGSTLYDYTSLTSQQTFTRWTGYVQSWPVSWPDGSDTFSTVQVTATDALARLARTTLKSVSENTIVSDSPLAYWQMSEVQGATQAADLMAGPIGVLTQRKSGTQALPVFGQTTGMPDNSTGCKFTNNSSGGSTGSYLANTISTTTLTSLHVEFVFTITQGTTGSFESLFGINDSTGAVGSYDFQIVMANHKILVFRYSGDFGYNIGSSLDDSQPHVISVEVDSTSTSIYIDGVKVTTDTGVSHTWNLGNGIRVCQGLTDTVAGTATIAHLNIGNRISDARVAAHHTALMLDGAGETPSARITRVLSGTGISTGSVDTAGTTLMGAGQQDGKNASDVLQETGDATQGIVWVDNNGAVSSINGYSFAADVTADVTLDANWLAEDLQFVIDMAYVVNYSVGKSTYTDNSTPPVQNAASVSQHGLYRSDYSWNVQTDAQALSRTNWKVNNYAQPQVRVGTLVIDLLSMRTDLVQAALLLDVGKYLQVTGLPSQTPGGTTATFLVEGITETLTDSTWTLTLNCINRVLVSAWVLGDSTWGVLGSTTKLFI